MKKRLFALLFCVILALSSLPSVPALQGEAERAADTLYTLGLLREGELDVKAPADRAAATILLVRLSGTTAAAPGGAAPFLDVPAWAAEAVNYAYGRGWVGGVSETSFAPEAPINVRAWFTMLLRMLGYQDKAGDFTYADADLFARRIGLVSRGYGTELTRGDLYESMLETLRFPYKDGSGRVVDRLVSNGVCAQAAVNALGFNQRELTPRQAADRHMAAVFGMLLYDSPESILSGKLSATGSGFFITPDGLAVTNYHTIEGIIRAVAVLSTGDSYEVTRVLWFDVNQDLAVIRVSRTSLTQKTTSAFACLELAGAEEARTGDVIYALSNPMNTGLAISTGVVSAAARIMDRYSVPVILNTADISSGSSGGALLNVYGQVIGVTSAVYRYGYGMFLAVPVDVIPTLDLTVEGSTLQEAADERAAQIAADWES